MKDDKNENSIGYKLGYALGLFMIVCVAVMIMAITFKFLSLLF